MTPKTGPSAERLDPPRSLDLLALAWAIGMFALSAIKYRYFLFNDFDLAIFAQSAHQLLHGSFFTSIRGMLWPGDHSSLVLIALAPLTAIAPPALVLVAVQATALAYGVRPLWSLARRRIGADGPATAIALLWLLQPALAHVALFEFHPETLATSALLAAFDAMERGRARTALAWAGWALLAKEDVALVVLGLAAWSWIAPPRARRLAAGFAALAAASLVLSFGFLKPRFGGGADYGMMYRDLGGTPAQVAMHLARHPLDAIARFVSTPGNPADSALKHSYWLQLLGPWLFLPALAPLALLPAAPIFAEHLLSFRPEQHTIACQYTSLLLPFVAIAAAGGLARLPRRLRAPALTLALTAAVAGQAAFGPWRAGADDGPPGQKVIPDGRDRALRPARESLLRALPDRGPLAASFVFLARLSARPAVHTLTHLTEGRFTFSRRAYPIPTDLVGLVDDRGWEDQLAGSSAPERARLAETIRRNALRPVAAAGDRVAYVRGAADTLALLAAGEAAPGDSTRALDPAFEFLGAALADSIARPGDALPVTLRWRRTAPTDTTYLVEIALIDAGGGDVAEDTHLPGYGPSPPSGWAAGRIYAERWTLIVPLDVPPGRYTLSMRPGRLAAQSLVAIDGDGEPATTIALGVVTILPRGRR